MKGNPSEGMNGCLDCIRLFNMFVKFSLLIQLPNRNQHLLLCVCVCK